jgi:hypothetical protein
MNKENILKLAEVLESPAAEKHFCMGTWFNDRAHEDGLPINETFAHSINNCNTTACIAGWCAVLAVPDRIVGRKNSEWEGHTWNGDTVFEVGRAYLELDPNAAERLFAPRGRAIAEDDPKQAAKVLRHLAETGEVDWSVIDAD